MSTSDPSVRRFFMEKCSVTGEEWPLNIGKRTPRGLPRNSVDKLLTISIFSELFTVDVKQQTNTSV